MADQSKPNPTAEKERAARSAALTRKLSAKPSDTPQEPFRGDVYAAGLYAGFHKHTMLVDGRTVLRPRGEGV